MKTLDERIEANRRRHRFSVAFLLFSLFAFNVSLGLWAGYLFQPWVGICLASVLIVLELLCYPLGMILAVSLVSRSLRGRVPKAREWDLLRPPLEDASIASGIELPDIIILDEDYCGAFTLMREGKGVVFITTSTLQLLDRDELRAVFAHEAAHIANGDVRYSNILAFISCPVRVLGKPFFRLIELAGGLVMILVTLLVLFHCGWKAGEDGTGVLTGFLLGFAYAAFCIALIYFVPGVVAQTNNFLADEYAVRSTLQPEKLMSAISKATGAVSDPSYSFMSLLLFAPGGVRGRGMSVSAIETLRLVERRLDILEEARLSKKPQPPWTDD